MNSDIRPLDFLCLGAQKAGTSYLVGALRSHPDIQLPGCKELHFFSPIGEYKSHGDFAQSNFGKDLDWHRQQFQVDDRVRGEVSTHYLFDPDCAKRIKRSFPDVKLFAILRNPVDRAFSQYNMERYKTAKERRPLMQIVRDEPDNEILMRGMYFQQLVPFMELFGPDQIRAYLFEDMISDPASFFADLYTFIGVDPGFMPSVTNRRVNSSRRTRFPLVTKGIRFTRRSLETLGLRSVVRSLIHVGAGRWIRNFNTRYNHIPVDFELSPGDRLALQEVYLPDIERLETLIARDLRAWKHGSS
jgi:hypothetical protein